ncbi:hypothetical protein [Natroniella sp. ANB-PHB2]|uniref:hypothetical protein n=1 Tax=Natroniella sp. ANB-PHB2 TaxID=3384444 RepID=UPI0038D3A677
MSAQVKGIVIEGVPATGKTTIIEHLLRNEQVLERDFMPLLVYGEDLTQRVLEAKHNQGQITKEDNLNLLNDILTPLERYQKYYHQRGWQGAEQEHCYAFLLERFHLTHATYFDHLNWGELIQIDDRLADLKTKLVLLTMNKEVMVERIVVSRGSRWRSYISRFGSTVEEIVEHYYQRQQRKLKLAQQSNLVSLVLNTSAKNWEELAQQVLKFWEI